MNKYSVLMSVYAKENSEFLKLSIESIMQQTIPPEQLIIVEDGPLTSELYSVIDYYLNITKSMISIVRLEQNQGLAIALDAGIAKSRNELIARMDSDDISLPQRCEKQLKRFDENAKLDLLGSFVDEFSDDPDSIHATRVVPRTYTNIKKFLRRRNAFNHPSVMYKKSAVIRCGGYGSLKRCQDFDLFSRMVNMGCYAENLPESLLLFRSNEGNCKRRMSNESTSAYIDVVRRNKKRGYCSAFDLAYVIVVRKITSVLPVSVMTWITDNFLRRKKRAGR